MTGKIILITGAGKGLGRSFAGAVAKGNTVVICSRTEADLKEVREEVKMRGGKCEYHVADVSKREEVEKLIGGVFHAHGRIDVLVNNAGWCHKEKNIEDLTGEDYEKSFRTNVDSVFYAMKKIIPAMKRQGSGMIVNISSGAGGIGRARLSAYAASKAAVNNLTVSAAQELEGTGVACIAVSLVGGFNTPMRREVFGPEDAAKRGDPSAAAAYIKSIIESDIPVRNGDVVEIFRDGTISVGGKR